MSEIMFRFSSSFNQGAFSNLFHLFDWTFLVFLISISAKTAFFCIFGQKFAHILTNQSGWLIKIYDWRKCEWPSARKWHFKICPNLNSWPLSKMLTLNFKRFRSLPFYWHRNPSLLKGTLIPWIHFSLMMVLPLTIINYRSDECFFMHKRLKTGKF